MSYKFGEEILVRDEYGDTWTKRIFIAMSEHKEAICVHEQYSNVFLRKEGFPCNFWREHKPLPKKKVIPYTLETFPLDNSGMVRGKGWEKGRFATIIAVDCLYVRFFIGGNTADCDYEYLAKHFEWLNKDGTTTPFGVEVDDE